MTEKEMIEEIANILETRIVNKTWRSKSVAREIYNAGYRKLDRDSVVITLSEYMGFKKLEIEKHIDEKFMSIIEGLNTPINKTTVKEEA